MPSTALGSCRQCAKLRLRSNHVTCRAKIMCRSCCSKAGSVEETDPDDANVDGATNTSRLEDEICRTRRHLWPQSEKLEAKAERLNAAANGTGLAIVKQLKRDAAKARWREARILDKGKGTRKKTAKASRSVV